MKTLFAILVGFLLTSCVSIDEPQDKVIAVSYELEVYYTNGDIDTLNVEFFTRESKLHLVGLDLKQNQGISYIHCNSCNDEYLQKVETVVADVRRYNILDYSFYHPN